METVPSSGGFFAPQPAVIAVKIKPGDTVEVVSGQVISPDSSDGQVDTWRLR